MLPSMESGWHPWSLGKHSADTGGHVGPLRQLCCEDRREGAVRVGMQELPQTPMENWEIKHWTQSYRVTQKSHSSVYSQAK